jgi:hypothetical protein
MTTADALDRVIETITVDCYNEDEEYTAFLTVIEDEVALPAPASLLGTPVTVVQLTTPTRREGWLRSAADRTAPARWPWRRGLSYRHAGCMAACRLPPPPWPPAVPRYPETRLDLAAGLIHHRWIAAEWPLSGCSSMVPSSSDRQLRHGQAGRGEEGL